MSVIENAIKRLQATQGTPGPARERLLPPGVARRWQSTGDTTTSTRIIPIDLDGLRSVGLLPPAHQERELAQQYRQIKRPLINSALGRGVERLPDGNLVMIASAVPGEGKTFTAINLALSMRLEEDVTVLLVDGDVVNPRLSQILGAADARGLLDVIKDPASLCPPPSCRPTFRDCRSCRPGIRIRTPPSCWRARGCRKSCRNWRPRIPRAWCCSTPRRCC